uniref:(northern house mosquito) hypothetical protein n=1 Tax=Culex pipiens TaxID=7175 RepID=A0A8D8IEP1_CULPI
MPTCSRRSRRIVPTGSTRSPTTRSSMRMTDRRYRTTRTNRRRKIWSFTAAIVSMLARSQDSLLLKTSATWTKKASATDSHARERLCHLRHRDAARSASVMSPHLN